MVWPKLNISKAFSHFVLGQSVFNYRPNFFVNFVHNQTVKCYMVFCALSYFIAMVWCFFLTSELLSEPIKLSTNAFATAKFPSVFGGVALAHNYQDELMGEIVRHNGSIPDRYLVEEMRRIGLYSYTHNFTLQNQFGKLQELTGKNVYGILRAPRNSGTHAIVLSTPYRPDLLHPSSTLPSIALMLSLATFIRGQKTWAKNIIFLFTEHEEIGMQAWLEAYHGVTCGSKGILNHGNLRGRAGTIHAAINLEMHTPLFKGIQIKVEGLNGQLPNLDLYCLGFNSALEYDIPLIINDEVEGTYDEPSFTLMLSFSKLMTMLTRQTIGIPTGNHGLYHRFGIHALTLESVVEVLDYEHMHDYVGMGRMLEDYLHVLNSNEQRFSGEFFYLLTAPFKYVPFDSYMPIIFFITAPLFITAYVHWHPFFDHYSPPKDSIEKTWKRRTKKWKKIKEPEDWKKMYKELLENYAPTPYFSDWIPIILIIVITHFLGFMIMDNPHIITFVGGIIEYFLRISIFYIVSLTLDRYYQYEAFSELGVCYGYVMLSMLLLIVPIIIPAKVRESIYSVLYIFALVELAVIIISVSFRNFALALLCGEIYVPFALMILHPHPKSPFTWLLVHPVLVLLGAVLTYKRIMFLEDEGLENLYRGFDAMHQSIVSSVQDYMIYGNWTFGVMVSVFIPNWVFFWIVAFTKAEQVDR